MLAINSGWPKLFSNYLSWMDRKEVSEPLSYVQRNLPETQINRSFYALAIDYLMQNIIT